MDVAALIAAIVVVLVLGLGGLLALRVHALIELSREVQRSARVDNAHTAKWRRGRLILMLCGLCVFYVVAAALFLAGRAMSGPRLAAGLVAAWVVVAVVAAFTAAIWWDTRHGNL